MLARTAKILMLAILTFTLKSTKGNIYVLTTYDGNVDLDTCPYKNVGINRYYRINTKSDYFELE